MLLRSWGQRNFIYSTSLEARKFYLFYSLGGKEILFIRSKYAKFSVKQSLGVPTAMLWLANELPGREDTTSRILQLHTIYPPCYFS